MQEQPTLIQGVPTFLKNSEQEFLSTLEKHLDNPSLVAFQLGSRADSQLVDRLCFDSDVRWRLAAVQSTLASSEALQKVAQLDSSFQVRQALYTQEDMDPQAVSVLLDTMANWTVPLRALPLSDLEVLKCISERDDLTAKLCEQLSELTRDVTVLSNVVENHQCPEHVLRRLFVEDAVPAATFLNNPNCPASVIQELWGTYGYMGATWVLSMHNAPLSILDQLAASSLSLTHWSRIFTDLEKASMAKSFAVDGIHLVIEVRELVALVFKANH